MSKDEDNLDSIREMVRTFTEAVAGLNKKDIRSIEGLLDEKVIMHTIRDPKRVDGGKTNVVNALNERVKKGGVHMGLRGPMTVDCEKGTVSGSADWTDYARGAKTPEHIRYVFTLARADGRKWLLTDMKASLA